MAGTAKTVVMAETGLKEAAEVSGGQLASLQGIGQWGCVEDTGD